MSSWEFSWTDVCPSGLRPWVKDYNDLAPCFQEICLQLPILVLFAVFSSYYYGSHFRLVFRSGTQRKAIRVRVAASIGLGLIPVMKIFYILRTHGKIYPIDVLLSCVQFVAWSVHVGFLVSSLKRGSLSQRGPLGIIVLWTSLLALASIWVHTNIHSEYWVWYVADLVVFGCYGVTLIAPGNAHFIRVQRTVDEERQALLTHTYTRFFEDIDESVLGPIQDDANFFSRLLFYWVKPLISKGVAGKLRKSDDLFDLPECLNMNRVVEKLQKQLTASASLFKALHKSFGWEFYLIGLLRLLADLSGFAGPILLGGLLRSENFPNVTEPATDPDCDSCQATDFRPYYYALGLLAATLISCFAGVHFNWKMTLVSTKMRMSLVTAIYRKSLTAKGLQSARPEILNLMSTDTDRIVNSCVSFHSFWSIPFQLFTTLYLLYTQLGLAFLAGVIFAIVLIPINRQIALKIGQLSQGLMTAKDGRIAITSETIAGAKHIKTNAWEDVFLNKIERIRAEEVGFLSRRKYLDALCVYFWATTPVLMCLLTFGTSVLLGSTLTAATTYTSVALLNMLIGPLNAFPWVLNGLAEAWVSLKRVQELIELPNINLSEYYKPLTETETSYSGASRRPVVIAIRDGHFEFDIRRSRKEVDLVQEDIVDFRFENLSLQIRQGELICLEGPVGGGKTSLLEVVLANFKCTQGVVALGNVEEGFGYVAQSAWLQRGTIRENILWGEMYDDARYKAVIHACALNYDLNLLKGDGTGVGEQGRTLSGGQRARVALARAIYQNKQIYLLDDILSALDAHVASHIVRHCIFGLLRDKTRIIVTQHPMVLNQANQILHVENGKVSQSDITSAASLMSDFEDDGEDLAGTHLNAEYEPQCTKGDDTKSLDSVMAEETREFGHLDRKVLGAYWSATGRSLGFWVVFSVLLMQVSRNLTDAWLAYWVGASSGGVPPPQPNDTLLELTDNDTIQNLWSIGSFRSILSMAQDFLSALVKGVDHDSELAEELQQEALLPEVNNKTLTMYYLGVYSALAVGNSLITLVRAFLFAFAGIRAAKYVHDKLLKSVLYTNFQFFDVAPLGRILNRFSSDVYTIDDSLPFIANILLAQFFGLLGALSISLYAMPWLGLLVIPLCPIYLSLQNQYRFASRDIKRLASNALSPLYAHFTETLQGMGTIRAMRGEARFRRDFSFKLEESIKAQLSASAAQQWLGLRLQLLGAVLVGGAGLLAAITSAHLTSPEMVGLTISYALSITGLLSGLLNAVSETEQEFVAVERVQQYCELEKEPNADGSADPPFGWPYQGVVQFENVFLRYREHLACALKGFTLHITSCERIGVVGRTGAGKSSVLASMLRVAPLDQGSVTIDNVNIATLPLDVLRSRVAVVSQDAFLFNGTIRENLDPRGLHLDSEIWEAITCCLASPLVQALGGLNAKLDPSGSNLSAGQRQLLCLTRALLKKSKIVLIDEGTANLDCESESAIQMVLKNAFRGRTVILIAHRLNGLQNTDRIVVMRDGVISEQGTPRELAANEESAFHSMLLEQQNTAFGQL
ncbi:multidrug resistance-associated protein [Culex quinquefasciatus]|uniref:ABC-type xenobiotic transporter n=2 Tax=Culex pipiens complex TaxID=518105 RepID=B0WBK8_CULQU|nr:multidrug resistance-associated protein [Culex quinquefasciatus]|eukprot:XP_001846092.1 multidrug resistance-associated protein [Culex quinquefasciatus]